METNMELIGPKLILDLSLLVASSSKKYVKSLTSKPARIPQVSKFLSVFDLASSIKLFIIEVDCI